MGTVIRLQDHARAGSRAARAVRISAVIPASTAGGAPSTADHHSAGMLSRCHHLETTAALAPTSAARLSRVGQSSMIERNDGSVMQPSIRQSVLKGKDILSADLLAMIGQTVPMAATDKSASHFKSLFIARTKLARERAGKSQDEIAADLGVPQPTYAKYETRTMLPHQFVPAFCAMCEITTAWLYTAAVTLPAAKPKRRRRRLAA